MGRTFVDHDLLTWEAYASTGDYGFPEHSRLVFQCVSDPARRARYISHQGDRSAVEREMWQASSDRLVELLEGAREVR